MVPSQKGFHQQLNFVSGPFSSKRKQDSLETLLREQRTRLRGGHLVSESGSQPTAATKQPRHPQHRRHTGGEALLHRKCQSTQRGGETELETHHHQLQSDHSSSRGSPGSPDDPETTGETAQSQSVPTIHSSELALNRTKGSNPGPCTLGPPVALCIPVHPKEVALPETCPDSFTRKPSEDRSFCSVLWGRTP